MAISRLSTLLFPALLCLAIMAGPAQAITIYKWTESNGTVSYGSNPPQGVKAEPLGAAVRQDTGNDRAADQASSEQQPAPVEAEEDDAQTIRSDDPEAMLAACITARENREVLADGSVEYVMDEKGQTPLEPEVREERLNETDAFIGQWCQQDTD